MNMSDISVRIQQLIDKSKTLIATKYDVTSKTRYPVTKRYVDSSKMKGLRVSVLSFISMVYGKEHSHYSEFKDVSNDNNYSTAEGAYEVLLSIQDEIDGGWIFSVKDLVLAEVFSNFIEMAEYLLENGYKDPSAVIIGSVLEESLRNFCQNNEIEISYEKKGTFIPKKADSLNSDLAKAEVYSKLDQKSVIAWLDLRNKAAHGKYEEYTKEQVEFMIQGVIDFLARMGRS